MSSIQKANALPTWWVGKSPKYGIQKRVKMLPGYTDEECQKSMKRILQRLDDAEDKRLAHEAYINSDEYPRSKIAKYKHKEIQMLESHIQHLHNQNNAGFAGGYTGPAIMSHKAEYDRIQAYEVKQRAEIEEKYKESPECLDRIRKQAIIDDKIEEEALRSARILNQVGYGGSLVPRVGGAAARHAAAHGGGFNHRGTYAGGVWK